MIKDDCILFEKFAWKLSDSNIIISRFVFVLTILYQLFSICVEEQQNAWPGNRVVKCAMRYNFERKFIGNESFSRMSTILRTIDGTRTGENLLLCFDDCLRLSSLHWKRSCQESFGMSQPAAALSITNMMNPHLFFCLSLSISFLLVALALACGKPVSPCYFVELFFIFVSVDLCWTKRMTEKFLWETLGCV